MKNLLAGSECGDGFGREKIESSSTEDPKYSDLRWGINKEDQNVHYLHGALHLFDTGTEITKIEYDGNNVIETIKEKLDAKIFPIFVTAGNGKEKLTHILHNSYLTYCYEKLRKIKGSLITFGFNFGDYDSHIIDAINDAAKQDHNSGKLYSIYIGVYNEDAIDHIDRIRGNFECKVNTFDATTTGVWQAGMGI